MLILVAPLIELPMSSEWLPIFLGVRLEGFTFECFYPAKIGKIGPDMIAL